MNILNLKQIWMVNELLMGALRDDFPLIHDNYFIRQVHEVNGVGH